MLSSKIFTANGKLLLSGEYAVLFGAKALAIPCKPGQTLLVEPHPGKEHFLYKAKLHDGSTWFQAKIQLEPLRLLSADNPDLGNFLIRALKACLQLNPQALQTLNGTAATTFLQFDKSYGLGSSSTWVSLLSQWLQVDAYQLNTVLFKGSGYDIACATEKSPLYFQILSTGPSIQKVNIPLLFHPSMHWVWLNKKAVSSFEIGKVNPANFTANLLSEISTLSEQLTETKNIETFKKLLEMHELIISKVIATKPVKTFFSDFPGTLKSLGAWGGDFILAIPDTYDFDVKGYFKEKSFETIFRSDDLFFSGTKDS